MVLNAHDNRFAFYMRFYWKQVANIPFYSDLAVCNVEPLHGILPGNHFENINNKNIWNFQEFNGRIRVIRL